MDFKLKINNVDVSNSNILDRIEFISDMGTSDFTVGKLIVPTIKTKFHNDVDIKIGDVITVYIDNVKYGTYEPYEIKQQNLYREVVLYSLPYFALAKTFQPSTTNYTTRSLLLEMQTAIGFTVVNFQNIVAVDMNDVKSDTGINLLQAIAMLLGTNITINAHGEIVFTDITTSTVYEISQSDITSITKADTTDYLISQIIGKLSDSDENPIIVGTSGNSWNDLTLINPYLTSAICTSILSKLPNYTGFDLTIFNAPLLKPLDKVKFTYKDTEYTIPVMNLTITFASSGLVAKVQSCVSNAQDKSSNYKGSLTTKLEVLQNVQSELNTKVQIVDGNVSSLITKTDVIGNKVDNLQVGGTNLILNSDFYLNKRTNWSYSASWLIHTTEKYKDKYIIHSSRTDLTSDSWSELRSNKVEAKEGEEFTMSLDVKWDMGDDYSTIAIWGYDADGANRKSLKEKRITGSQDWHRFVLTGTVPTGVAHVRACISHKRNGSIYATNFKLERGNVATDWSPSLEDTQNATSTLINEQYSQINQTIGEIDLRVGQITTELGDKVSTNEVISSINLSTEGVKIDGSKILLTGDTIIIGSNGEQTITQFLKDEGENLLLKPNFNDGTLNNWSWSVSSYIYVDTTYKHEENTACKLQYTGTSNAISLSTTSMSISKFENGKTYKASVWMYVEDKATLKSSAYLRVGGIATGTTSQVTIAEREITQNNLVNGEWTQLSFEFTATQDYSSPRLLFASAGIVAWVTDFNLQEQGGLSQTEMVKILNGAGDGLYLVDGQLLINAEYIQTGTVRADLVKVQLDEVSNLLPFNYITMKNGINTDGFYINEDNDGLPFADCSLPIYGGGGGSEYFTKPFGYSNVTIESGKHYWFTCEYYAVWNNDTKAEDGVGTSTAIPNGASKYGTKTGNNMDIFLSNGTYGDIADNGNFFMLASVKDFNASINIVERENYAGVYERGWTRLVGRIDATESYTGNLWIQIDGRGFDVGDTGYFYLRNLQLVDTSVADESVKLDYIKQVNEKRIELSDGSYYTGLYSVDGINLIEGTIEGTSDTERRKFTLDYDGYRLNATTGSDNAFIGENRSRYSYNAGSSGILDGYDSIYGVGASQQIESTGNREGIFVGVHYGYQIPNDTAYGRADIYGYNRYSDNTSGDWTDWNLLGEKVEPNGLVRRDSNCNIITQNQLLFNDSNAIVNIADTNFDLGSLFGVVATTMIDENGEEIQVQQPEIITIVAQLQSDNEELKAKNQELEERLAKLEALLLSE